MDRVIQLLKWSEKYTKTDMTYLVKGSFWLLAGQAVNFVLALVLLWVFANLVSKEVYGEYRFLLTVVSLLALTSLNGTGVALTNSVALGMRATFFPLLRARIRYGLVGSAAALVGAGYYLWQGNTGLAQAFTLIALFVPFIESYTLYAAYLNGVKDFRLMAILHTLQRITTVSALVAAVILTQSVFWILCTYLIGMTLSFKAAQAWTLRTHPTNEDSDPGALTYAKHLSLMSIMRSGAQYLDKLALWYFAGPVAVAQYVVAIAMPNEIIAAFSQISRLALPKMSTRNKTELQQSMLRKIFIYFLAMLPVAITYVLSAPLIFRTFLPQYLDSVLFSQLATILIVAAPLGLLTQYFFATKHTTALYIINTLEPIVLIGLYVILIPLYGIMGVIFASFLRFVFIFFSLLFFFLRDRTQ